MATGGEFATSLALIWHQTDQTEDRSLSRTLATATAELSPTAPHQDVETSTGRIPARDTRIGAVQRELFE
jgi:hypothetical protein